MSDRPTATTNRRTILKAGSTLAFAGLITPAATVAQTDLPIEIEQFLEEEYVVLRNVGDEDVDLTGYSINFEAEDEDYNQVRQLSGDVVLGPGEEVSVATGDETTVSTDVTLVDPYDGFVLNNEGTDEVALLDPDGNVVVSTGDSDDEDSSDGGNGDDSDGDGGDSNDGGDGDDSDGGDGDDSDGGDGDDGDSSEGSNEDDSDGDGTDSSGDDKGDGSDDSDESTDDSDTDDEDKEKTDADGDGVAATDDADDDCAKVS